MARNKPTPAPELPSPFSTVEDIGLASVCASAPVSVGGVPTIAPGIVAGRKKPAPPDTKSKRFKFRVSNDFAGKFEGELFGESADEIRAQLIARLTAGIQIFEVI